jgi:hypothetical protein
MIFIIDKRNQLLLLINSFNFCYLNYILSFKFHCIFQFLIAINIRSIYLKVNYPKILLLNPNKILEFPQ